MVRGLAARPWLLLASTPYGAAPAISSLQNGETPRNLTEPGRFFWRVVCRGLLRSGGAENLKNVVYGIAAHYIAGCSGICASQVSLRLLNRSHRPRSRRID